MIRRRHAVALIWPADRLLGPEIRQPLAKARTRRAARAARDELATAEFVVDAVTNHDARLEVCRVDPLGFVEVDSIPPLEAAR